MFNSYVIEVPNTNIREERTSLDECWDICYDLAQEYGLAEVCLLYTSDAADDP